MILRLSKSLFFCFVVLVAWGLLAQASAPEAPEIQWPGLWGPQRNAQVGSTLSLPAHPRLRVVWRQAVGKGYSEVVAHGERAYLAATDGEQDFLAALNLVDGKERWRRVLGPTYRGHDGSDDGPIATPALGGGRIFVATPFGVLLALQEETGEELWRLDLKEAFGAQLPYYGYASSPLLVDGLLIVQTGAKEGQQLVALDPATGAVRWAVHPAAGNGYSSPVAISIAATAGATRQLVAATTEKTFAVDGATGETLWSVATSGEPRQSPLGLPGNRLLLTRFEESTLLQLKQEAKAWTVEELWRLPVLKASYSPTVFHQGFLYGMNRTYLVCVEAATGDLRWREKVYNGNLVLVGDVLALMGERSGTFRLVAADPTGYKELLSEQLTEPGPRVVTGMAVLGDRFLIRNSEELIFVEIGSGEPALSAAGEAGR